jgi:hypothetical protein
MTLLLTLGWNGVKDRLARQSLDTSEAAFIILSHQQVIVSSHSLSLEEKFTIFYLGGDKALRIAELYSAN